MLLPLLAGCSGIGERSDEPSSIANEGDALVSVVSGQEFKYLSAIPALSTGTGDGAMCTPNAPHSKIIFTRDTSGYIQGLADVIGIWGSWGKYGGSGSTRKFATHPACAFLDVSGTTAHFILLARGSTAPGGATDKHLFWSKGEWTATASAPAPAAQTAWAQIGGANETYNSNGMPAVASHDGALVVVYLDDSGNIKGNYWTGSSFSSTVSGPAKPAGWTPVGTPSIAFVEGWAQKFMIFVRMTNNVGQSRIYHTFFSGTSFVGAPGGSPSYQQLTLPAGAPQVQSDPALEWDGNVEESKTWSTLYYRNGTKLYQLTSENIYDFATSTVKQITLGIGTPSILNTANPVAIGGVPYEAGRHWVLVRSTNNDLLFGESFNDDTLVAN